MLIAVAGATGRVGSHVVDVAEERGHDVAPISRTHGVDVITGQGLADALKGVDCIIDASTGPSPDRDDPDAEAQADGVLLPGPHAILAGPTFEAWLATAEV